MGKSSLKLQILICTFGRKGVERIAKAGHPEVDGVEYLVSWQNSDGIALPPALERKDFKIVRTDSIGLSVNRNTALLHASAPISLIADDDLKYSEEALKNVINTFEEHPDKDVITFCYTCDEFPPSYPAPQFSLNNPPKGYHPVSFEIAFRTSAVVSKFKFNEWFGIGALFPSGEEDLFLYDLLSGGLQGIHVPIILARHHGPTTSDRVFRNRSFIVTKGAVFSRLFPMTCFLRMLTHAFRFSPRSLSGMRNYCKNWIAGHRLAKRHKVF